MHVSLVYRWLIGTRVIFFWSFGDVVLVSAFERYQCTQDCPTFVTQQPDRIFENLSLFGVATAFPGIYIRFLLSRPDQSPGTSGVGGRSPGSPLSKITKQWTNPVFPCEYTNHEDAEFAMVMLDYWRVHRMTEIIFDRTGFNKHLALSPKGLLFGSWPWTCIVTYVWTANDKLKRHNLERPTTLRELCWLIIAWSVFRPQVIPGCFVTINPLR